MLLKRICLNIAAFNRKICFSTKYFTSRVFSFRAIPKVKNKYSCHTNILIASTALGLSVYIACKRITHCETVNLFESESLNETDRFYDNAIRKSRDLLQRLKDEVGAPGLVAGVSVDGKSVWTEGFGYADVENRVLCTSDTVIRIASISKSITMAAVAKLWEQGKIDLDKPIQDYVPYFPSKVYDGNPVTITCRLLVSHLGGIRHYDKSSNNANSKMSEKGTEEKLEQADKQEFDFDEYYITDHFKDIKSSVNLFKDDPLIANPGSKFNYTTHGWTLISAIVEAAAKEPFSTHITKLFKSLGMSNTYLDVNDVLIYHRSRNYKKDKNGHLINAPYVNNSYKWAGGGFLSTVKDLLQFGNAMLYSFQYKNINQNVKNKNKLLHKNVPNTNGNNLYNPSNKVNVTSNNKILPGFLDAKTVETMWTPVARYKETTYGMGWFVQPEVNECLFCESKKFCVCHTGGAVGASSVLLILPQKSNDNDTNDLSEFYIPKGVIVVILVNLQDVRLMPTALKIAQHFENKYY